MKQHRIVQFSTAGDPAEVVKCLEAPPLPPQAGEVAIAMEFAPVNPADLNYLEGTYGKIASLPATPGVEGFGRIAEIGEGVTSLAAGDPVVLVNHMGSWAERLTVSVEHVVKIPQGVPPEQAAMLRINPPTAWRLLKGFLDLEAGAWVGQNAANSGVGLSLIQIAKQLNLRTVNFVRSESAAETCRAHGAEHVFLDTPEGLAESKAMLGDEAPQLCANAVGGDSALRLMDLLGSEGTHVTYGAMSRQSLKVPNKFLIFKRIQLHGLWITKWMENPANREEVDALLQELGGMMRDGNLSVPVEQAYPLEQVAAAITHAQRSERIGKILLQLGESA